MTRPWILGCAFAGVLLQLRSDAQVDTLRSPFPRTRSEIGLLLGYNKEIGAAHNAPIHFVELGIAKASYGGRHPVSGSMYASTLFGLLGDTPILSPRIGVNIAMLLSFGTEVAYYTDLNEGSLAVVPSIGFGGYPLNIAIKPNLYVLHSSFKPAGGGTLSITYRIVALKRKEID
ncbi:MAG TPA: hypothetical protein VGE21_05415 [Flavobacteriales bacterium]